MAIDARYILSPPLWQLFTDKDTLEFLANGYVLFFDDNSRTVGKPVYMITGSPPNYSYIAYGNYDINGAWRVDLNDQGAFDNAVYLFPYLTDGTTVDNYFIQWYSNAGVLQNSREGWPNIPGNSVGPGNIVQENLIPNPQFIVGVSPNLIPEKIGQASPGNNFLGGGGWVYQLPVGSTSVDVISFPPFNSFITNPPANPRFAININCTDPDPADISKYLFVEFNNVNKFASSVNQFTFSFSGIINTGSMSVQIVLIKNFGTGGSPQTVTSLGSATLTTSYQNFPLSFTFGTNAGDTIGEPYTDFVGIGISFLTSLSFNVTLTDFLLTPGIVASPILADLPDDIYVSQSLAGYYPPPQVDSSDLYLPVINTVSGFAPDTSWVGMVIAQAGGIVGPGWKICDGSAYDSYAHDPDTNVPYSRLATSIFDSVQGNFYYGTATNYVTTDALTSAASDVLRLTINTAGAVTAAADGGAPTGFSFSALYNPTAQSSFKAYCAGTSVYIRNVNVGLVNITQFNWTIISVANTSSSAPFRVGTCGFTFPEILSNVTGQAMRPTNDNYFAYGPQINQIIEIQTVAAAGLAGTYFSVCDPTTVTAGVARAAYYFWFTVNGAGADPGVSDTTGAIGIQIPLLSTHTANDVATLICCAINGLQQQYISTIAGAAVPASSYFTFSSSGANYYAWYTKNGVGTDPAIAGKTPVPISILSTDTATQVMQKTISGINFKTFKVPDLRGISIMGWDNVTFFDPEVSRRWHFGGTSFATSFGGYQFDSNKQHGHYLSNDGLPTFISVTHGSPDVIPAFMNQNDPGPPTITGDQIFQTGSSTSRPINVAMYYLIHI